MSITVFAYILLAALLLMAAYLVGVSSIEPPLEHYDRGNENEPLWQDS